MWKFKVVKSIASIKTNETNLIDLAFFETIDEAQKIYNSLEPEHAIGVGYEIHELYQNGFSCIDFKES